MKTLNKPVSRKTRRILSRVKTITIIALILAVIAEYGYLKKTEGIYKDRTSEYKGVIQNIKQDLNNFNEELILVRNSMPIDIEKMGNITNTIVAIKKLVPRLELPAAEYYASLIVNETSKYENLNSNMLVSLFRQESNFYPDITSWAGAVGMGQIMPETGRWIVEDKWHLPYNDSMLFDPVQNIKISAWYLSYLITTNGNNFKIALAYYNGGSWQAKRYRLLLMKNQGIILSAEELAQIERIPEETFNYVPKVSKYYDSINGLRIETIKAANN